jgi:uncharacterized membrane protein YfcA
MKGSLTKSSDMQHPLKMVSEIATLVAHHYREGNINWPMVVYLSLVHIYAVVGLFTIPKCSSETLLWAFLLWPIR